MSYDVEEYGLTQPYWEPDEGINSYGSIDRKSRSMIPPEYAYAGASSFRWNLYDEDLAAQKKIANAFLLNYEKFKEVGKGLYIFSQERGSGKTMLACCLCNEIMERYKSSVKFISQLDFIELIKSKEKEEQEAVFSLYNASLLAFDDIGAFGKREWIESEILRLVDHRKRELLPTIFTSNYSIENLGIDSRIVSRIEAMSIPLKLPEKSIRSMKAKEENRDFLKGLDL